MPFPCFLKPNFGCKSYMHSTLLCATVRAAISWGVAQVYFLQDQAVVAKVSVR